MSKTVEKGEFPESEQVKVLSEALKTISREYDNLQWRLEESLSGLDAMMRRDDWGWSALGNYEQETGPSLSQLKRRAKQLREATALEPTIKHGSDLISNYVWSDPITYKNVPGYNGTPSGTGRKDVGKIINSPWNKQQVFGPEARKIRSKALYTDGGYFLEGDNKTKKLRPIPLERISDVYCNPEWPDEIWAYRLSWFPPTPTGIPDVEKVEWVFTDFYDQTKPKTITNNGKAEPVNADKTIIDGWVNKQVGWRFGFPHAGAILEWVVCYNEFLRAGMDMNKAMASIWAIAKKETAKGTQNTAAKIAGMTGSGNTAVGDVDFSTLATAGKAYDFKAGTPIIARAAAGLGLSVVALTASPGDAGASYGAAETLSLPERLMIEGERQWNAEFDERVLRWAGAPDATAEFAPLVDATELLRLKQSAQLDWNSGLYSAKEAKAKFEAAEGNRSEVGDVPEGVMLPNNEKSIARRDIDPNTSGSATSGAIGGQGQSTGTGNIESPRDTRTDTIS